MSTIDEQLQLIRQNKQIGLMTHVVAGYPSLAETEKLVMLMEKAGVDFIEIQIPFSDPIADGPTIMQANDVALENKVTLSDVLQLMHRLTRTVKIPLLCMGYYNTLFNYGVERFCSDAQKTGAQGLIIPDIPLDEEVHEHFMQTCQKFGLSHIRVLSPTSTDQRIIQNIRVANGFIYCTAVSGTTGTRSQIDPVTKAFLKKMRRHTPLPLAVGFGISKPEHVQSFIGSADIAVVGSAVIQLIRQKGIQAVEPYIRSLVVGGK